MKTKFPKICLTAGLLATLSVSCKKDDSSDPAPEAAATETSTGTETEITTTSSLSTAFPGSLAITVFPSVSGTALGLEGDDFDPNAQTMEDKIKEQEKIAKGEADSCLPPSLGKNFNKSPDETCYEFDQDMIYATNDSTQTTPQYRGTKNGKNSKGEACLVAFTRNQVTQITATVDQTLGFGMAALCQRKKDGEAELPAVGETLDLASSLSKAFGGKITVESAKLERLADVAEKPVFRITITVLDKNSIKRTVGITHSPTDATNSTYTGSLYTVMEGNPFPQAGGNQPADTKHHTLSIRYERKAETDGTTSLNAELRVAQVAAALSSKVIVNGEVDYNVGADLTGETTANGYGNYTGYQQANDAVAGMTFVAFKLNPDTNAGTFAYWKNPGGNYRENARGFNIAIEAAADGTLGGCATSGSASVDFSSGISIRRYLNAAEAAQSLTLSPKGFYHPFHNMSTATGSDADGDFFTRSQMSGQVAKWYKPALTDATLSNTFVSQQTGSLITRQCFKQNATSGLYEIDTAKTTEGAGYELIDTGSTVNAQKFVALPPRPADAPKPAN